MLTHQNLSSNGRTLVEYWGFSDRDVLLHALPIFHVHGLFVAVSCVLLAGASMRWLSGFQIDQVLAELPHSTVMMGVPTYYTRLLADDRFGDGLTQNSRLFVSGSAPLLQETFHEFEARTGHRILERYGMSETGMNTSNPLFGERKAGTVGFPLPDINVRVVDDSGASLHSGQIGNIQVKGPNVFKGYWKLPEKTEQDFTRDGFFDTGDKGCFDDAGYLSIVGRAKDMVITGGLNVYPKEVELVIDDLEGILESAVIGVPHADFGEAVVAVVVLRAGCAFDESELISQIKDKLSSFKVPKRIVAREELPRNTMGKVQKAVLRSEYEGFFK
jgi:malonyl-CoA/methylmalonyl-CoA synthetase